jgi:uncharacterized protein (TIGR00369 family)
VGFALKLILGDISEPSERPRDRAPDLRVASGPQLDAERTRTVSWEDPLPALARAARLSGLEYLRGIQAGDFPPPPIARLMGFELVEVDPGRAVFAVEPAEFHYNPLGSVHGGLAATLLDSAMGCAVQSTLPAGRAFTTLELKTNYVRAMTVATGPVTATGEVLSSGSRVATAEGRVEDSQGRLLAHATTTCLIFDVPDKGATHADD